MAARTPWRNRIVGQGEEPPDQLVANPRNWRLHPEHQRRALAGVLSEVGWVQDVVVNRRSGQLVDGHLRVALALQRGEPSVPVKYVDLDEREEALVLATFDPISGLARADGDALDSLLRGVEASTSAVSDLLDRVANDAGLPAGGTAVGLVDADDTPPGPEAPDVYVQRGELYRLGRHRLLSGDATNATDVDRLLDGQQAALLATDPPYLVDYRGGNHPQSWGTTPDPDGERWDDYRDPEQAVAFFAGFLRLALGHLRDGAAVYQWHAHRRQALVEQAWRDCGLLVHQQIIWVKSRAVLTRSHYSWRHEPCFYGWVQGTPPVRRPLAGESTVWEVDQRDQSGLHPTQKPVALFERPLMHHTVPGEVCYEPFSGSGTQLIAAERLGRRCYAMELDPAYVQVAIERWERFTGLSAERI